MYSASVRPSSTPRTAAIGCRNPIGFSSSGKSSHSPVRGLVNQVLVPIRIASTSM